MTSPSNNTIDKENTQTDPQNPDPTNPLQDSSTSLGPAPNGGFHAWINVAGAFCISFGCLGFTTCLGVLQQYYSTHQLHQHTLDKIAWIGSVSSFIQFAGGAVGGPLLDRYGSAWTIRPATLVYVLSLMMLSLCTEYFQFMLAQGILMGSAVALMQIPAFAVVGQYFDEKRATALGICASGSSIGGVIFPIVLSKLLNTTQVGFAWSMRIIAFIILPFMMFACIVIRPRVPPRKTTILLGAAWKQPQYVLLVVGMFFMMMGMWTPVFYLPIYAVSRGMGTALAAYLLAIINASSTFGRIIPGILADKFGRLNVFAFAGISTGLMAFCINEPKNNVAIIVYAVFFGFASGTIISSTGAAISLTTNDPRNIGTYMGMGMGLAAFAVLVGPPINGTLIDRYGGFTQASIFSGAVSTLGACIVLSSKFTTAEGIFGRV